MECKLRQLLVCYLPVKILKLWRDVFDWWSWLMVCGLYSPGKTFFVHVNGTLPINHSSGWNVQGYLALSLFLSIFFRRCTILTPLNQSSMHRMHQVNVIFPMWEAYPGAKNHLLSRRHDSWCSIFYPNDGHAMPLFTSLNQWNKCKMLTLYCTYKMSCWADLLFLLQDLKICMRMY